MKFGDIPIDDAQGAILAHSLQAGGVRFRKGRVLSAEDIAAFRKAGIATITGARLEAGDVGEDEAAQRIATAAAGPGLRVAAAFTGRCNIYAKTDGVVLVDESVAAALNNLDESITIATLAPYAHVAGRQMVATVKIIPFAAPRMAVAQATEILAKAKLLSLAPFRPHRVALISTSLPGMKASLLDKNRLALEARVTALGSELAFERRVPHETAALSEAIAQAQSEDMDPILIFGASAITDRRDVIPAAIVRAGGTVDHLGMPVDPGNLLLLGHLGDTRTIGLPGCARSPKQNGFDFVLQRLLAGLPVGRREIAAMGVGGLLTEIGSRPQPRDEAARAPHAPKIAAVVLAAGLSSRMGRNKLLAQLDGRSLLRHVVEAARASSADPVLVVTGHDREPAERALEGLSVRFVHNPHYAEGLSTSLKAGIAAVPQDCDGALVLLGDMPGIATSLIDKTIEAFSPENGRLICVATRHGKRGNPVLWARHFFPEIMALAGDTGAKSLIAPNDDVVCEIEADDDGPLLDIDTPEDLAAYGASR